MQFLLELGADVDCRNGRDESPQRLVSEVGWMHEDYHDPATVLLDHGTDVNNRIRQGWTPLHLASS